MFTKYVYNVLEGVIVNINVTITNLTRKIFNVK